MKHSRFRLSLRSQPSHRALRGETGSGPYGRPKDIQPRRQHHGRQTREDWLTVRGFYGFPGSTDSTPRWWREREEPSMFWAQLFPFRHPSPFLLHVGKCEPSPFYQDFPGGRLNQCDMIYTPFQRPMFTRCKLSPGSDSGPQAQGSQSWSLSPQSSSRSKAAQPDQMGSQIRAGH